MFVQSGSSSLTAEPVDRRRLVGVVALAAIALVTVLSTVATPGGAEMFVDAIRFEVPTALVALAFHLAYYAGNYDLTVAGLYPVCLVLLGRFGAPSDLLILAMLVGVAVAGYLVGEVYWLLKSSFLPGLFGYAVFRGIAFNVSPASTSVSTGSSALLRALGSPAWGFAMQLACLALIVGWCKYIASRTDIGRRARSVGLDARWADLVGINVRRTRVAVHAFTALLVGIAAMMAVSRIGTAGPDVGDEVLLSAPVAAVLGNGGLTRLTPAPIRVVLASLLLSVVRSELSLVGWGTDRVSVLIGLIGLSVLAGELLVTRMDSAA